MDHSNKTSKNSILQSPAQYVILDVGIPTPANITTNVLTAIQNVLCLRSTHVQVIGVGLINSVFEQVVTLSSTNSELHKILRALNTVIDNVKFRARTSMEEFQDNVYFGVKRALEDFQSFPRKREYNKNCPVELQVTILSMKNGFEIQFYIQKLLTALPTEQLTKIQVVELVQDYMEVEANQNCWGVSRLIEFLRVPGSSARLDELMKQWILRGAMEREDVRIVLQDCMILCDIQECLIHPRLDTTEKNQTIQDPSGSLRLEAAPLHLEVTHRLASDGICEAQMCGDPVILVPTQCYQLTWPEKQVNQQYYLTLIQKVTMTKENIVAKLEVRGQPLKYFILMPGDDFILMRTLVTAEVVMPFPGNLTFEMDQEIDNNTTEALLSVPTIKAYDPADFSTGLYKHLFQTAVHPTHDLSQGGLSRTNTKEPLCKDPAHRSIVVGIEIKKTIKRKKSSGMKLKKSSTNDLPKLSLSDQQTLTDFFSRKTQK